MNGEVRWHFLANLVGATAVRQLLRRPGEVFMPLRSAKRDGSIPWRFSLGDGASCPSNCRGFAARAGYDDDIP